MVGVAPCVGREDEQRLLDDVLARAARSAGGVVVLTGPAGIGKTRVAEEVAATARSAFDVVSAACGPQATMPPYWPWSQVLGDRLGLNGRTIRRLERSEQDGVVRLDTLARAADALGCDLVYAIVPRRPLEQSVFERALELRALPTVAHPE